MNWRISLGDRGQHVYDRFLILSCENVIPKEKMDSNLREKLFAERDITSSVAVQFLLNTIKNGYKFTESERTKQNRKEYEIRNNSLKLFLTECCKLGEGRTPTPVFKDKYKKFCRENKLVEEKAKDISKILENEFGITKKKSYNEYYELTVKDI